MLTYTLFIVGYFFCRPSHSIQPFLGKLVILALTKNPTPVHVDPGKIPQKTSLSLWGLEKEILNEDAEDLKRLDVQKSFLGLS